MMMDLGIAPPSVPHSPTASVSSVVKRSDSVPLFQVCKPHGPVLAPIKDLALTNKGSWDVGPAGLAYSNKASLGSLRQIRPTGARRMSSDAHAVRADTWLQSFERMSVV